MRIECLRCDAELECTPEGACWCMELPPLPITGDISGERCLCRPCLDQRVREAEAARAHAHVDERLTRVERPVVDQRAAVSAFDPKVDNCLCAGRLD